MADVEEKILDKEEDLANRSDDEEHVVAQILKGVNRDLRWHSF